MLNKKITKIISAAICALLALVLLFTMFSSAFAEEQPEYIAYETETGAIIEHQKGAIAESFAAVELVGRIDLVPSDDENYTSFVTGISSYLNEGYTVDNLYLYYIAVKDDHPDYGATAGTIVNPTLFTADTVVYIPVPDEMTGYKYLDLLYIGYGATTEQIGAERVTRDGKDYLKATVGSYGYLAVCHKNDESGSPIFLKWYEKGFFGSVYSFGRQFWGLLLLVTLGIVYIIWFFNPNRPRGKKKDKAAGLPKDTDPSPEQETDAETAAEPEQKTDDEKAAEPAEENDTENK